jgi:hypothetical protein
MGILKISLAILKRYAILDNREYHENMEERKMEKKLEKLEVSYVYDPGRRTLECDVKYNGITDSFVCMYDGTLMWNTIQEFVNGFVQYLMEKEKES